ncbi:hypothetical protein [Nesterenkonia jeotgali]|uniref:Uncharacterized protein n=1 Tax=Nesterenkonia jeotgali TaxID=317018 RepID=A0A0W8IFZ4_9MICC|nr:hypothetical protein [Nesterenkonia jeotgali]KUG58946.1 hypothetical protein AVL63_02680 [Nesterenkonia jeotgali]
MTAPPPHVAAYRQRTILWTLATLAGVLLFALNIHTDPHVSLIGAFLTGAIGVPGLLLDQAQEQTT